MVLWTTKGRETGLHLPLVPAPTYITRPPRLTRTCRRSIARAISARQGVMLGAMLWSSWFMIVHIRKVETVSVSLVRGFSVSVCKRERLITGAMMSVSFSGCW